MMAVCDWMAELFNVCLACYPEHRSSWPHTSPWTEDVKCIGRDSELTCIGTRPACWRGNKQATLLPTPERSAKHEDVQGSAAPWEVKGLGGQLARPGSTPFLLSALSAGVES